MYTYVVDPGPNDLIMDFLVGTCDPNIANYFNWIMPPGWVAQIVGAPLLDNGFTPKGGLSSPTGNCVAGILFQGPPSPADLFGFDHQGHPHDVGWQVATTRGGANENWMMPVGLGQGPVHGPLDPGIVNP
jgi:hypothetical protein